MDQTGGVYRSYLWKLNPANGAALDVKQIGTGANYFAVTDMTKGLNGQLYLCGYNQATYTNTASRKAFICKYETPSTPTGIDWSNAVVNLSTSSNQYNYASKLAVNTNDGSVLISGTFGISSYLFGGTTYLYLGSGSGTLYNHFAAKFNPTPTQLNLVWQTGLGGFYLNANSSGGNSMVYDSDHNMFYIGGAFNGQLGLNQQGYFTANSGADAFVARFEDLGEAYYKDFQIQNPYALLAVPYLPRSPARQNHERPLRKECEEHCEFALIGSDAPSLFPLRLHSQPLEVYFQRQGNAEFPPDPS